MAERHTLNQLFRSLCRFSGFRSPWSLLNKDDRTENGAVSLFCGGGGKLRSTSVDGALIGGGYEGWGSVGDMVDADKIHINPKARNDFGREARLEARDMDLRSHVAHWLTTVEAELQLHLVSSQPSLPHFDTQTTNPQAAFPTAPYRPWLPRIPSTPCSGGRHTTRA